MPNSECPIVTSKNESTFKSSEVDKVFSLEEVRDAFDYLEKEHTKGKVVVKIK